MEIKDYGPLPNFDGGIFREELWLQIFLRSSGDSVARFTAVSKSWYGFLNNNNFRKLYQKSAFLGKDDDLIIVSGSVSVRGSGGDRNSILSIRKTVFHDYDVRLIGLPVCAFEMILVGSCDGLLCLTDKPKDMERILLWNPGTGEEKLIKVPPTESRNKSTCIGYVNRNDYKVIRLVDVDSKFTSLVQVYSLSEDIWKDSITIPFYPDGHVSSFNIGGIPYWLGYDTRAKNIIFSFDPASEVSDKIDYPPQLYPSNVYPMNIRDKVCALVVCEELIDIYCFEESTLTWIKETKTGKLHIELEWVRKLHCYQDSGDVVAFGWPDSEITISDVANDGFLSHVSMKMGTVLFKPDLKGPFAYTGAYNVKIPGGKKVLEAQPRTDGKFWNLKRTKENVAALPELKPTLVNNVLVDVIEALSGRSLGSHSEIALSPLACVFRGNKEVSELALEELVHLSEQPDLAEKNGSHGYGWKVHGNAMPGRCWIHEVVNKVTCESHTFG